MLEYHCEMDSEAEKGGMHHIGTVASAPLSVQVEA